MIAALVAAACAVPLGVVIDALAERLARPWAEAPPADDAPGTPEAALSRNALPFFLGDGAQWRTLAVTTTSVLMGFLLGLQYGAGWEVVVAGSYAAVLLACTVTDLLVRRLPNVFVYPAIAVAFAVGMSAPEDGRVDVLAGGALSGGVFLAMALLPQGGFGDAKLGLFMGLALGLELTVPAVIITTLSGAAISALILVATRMRALHQPIPYGPYIALGTIVVMLVSGTAFERV